MKIRRMRDGEVFNQVRGRRRWLPAIALLVAVLCVAGAVGCNPGDGGNGNGETTLRSIGGAGAGDIEGSVGEDIEVEDAVVTVRALEAAFQPAMPAQRLSDETPTAPGAGEGFYQAYVRVENNRDTPIRVSPEDFVCAVGNMVVRIEPTRSGPLSRSLLPGTSLDLLLTFKAQTGFEPVLLYSPSWYDGVIRVSPEAGTPSTTTTEA